MSVFRTWNAIFLVAKSIFLDYSHNLSFVLKGRFMPKNAHPEDVKARVRKTGISLAELARRNEMVGGTGARALYEPCPRMNHAIAKHLGVSVHDLWPEWFDKAGERILRFSRETTTGKTAESRQNREAA